jgi:hypothetical protein
MLTQVEDLFRFQGPVRGFHLIVASFDPQTEGLPPPLDLARAATRAPWSTPWVRHLAEALNERRDPRCFAGWKELVAP